jgi:ABC-type Fe3+ transport system permease subunit
MDPLSRRLRLALTAALAIYGWICLRSPDTYRWLDSLDLAIHETGHLVFGFDGETLAVLGGTLLQLLVPMAFTEALWHQGDRHGATVPLWWLGQSCWNVARYVRDARTQALPLVGGGEHDWTWLLSHWGVLARDQAIGRTVYLAGVLCYLAAIVGGWLALQSAERKMPPQPQEIG